MRDREAQQGGFSSGFVNGGDASSRGGGGSSYSYESSGSSEGSSSRLVNILSSFFGFSFSAPRNIISNYYTQAFFPSFYCPCPSSSSSGGGGRRRQGWTLNEDGTWVRSRTSTSSQSSETQYGAGYDGYAAGGNQVNVGGGRGGHEDGDVGHNTTGSVREKVFGCKLNLYFSTYKSAMLTDHGDNKRIASFTRISPPKR